VSVHAAIGLRTIISEWTALRSGVLNVLALGIFALLLGMGGRAVLAVTML